MKIFNIVKAFIGLLIFFVCTTNTSAQIIIGGAPARFGIDADVISNQHLFGASMPAPAGSDDWFSNAGGTGVGVIDTTGGTAIKNKLQAGANFLFEMPMAFPKFSVQNGIVMIDGRFAHDNTGNDSTTFTQGKNGDDPTTWSTNSNGSAILDKSDIVDTYIHLRRNGTVISGPNPSPLVLIMGGSVASSSGAHYLDFELFKQKMRYNRTTGKFENSGPASTGGHTKWEFRADASVSEIGDMQVSFSFSSASVSSLNIYIWVSLSDYNNVTPQKFDFVPGSFNPGTIAGYGYAEITSKASSGPLPVWGVVNSTGISAAPFWGTCDKGGSGANGYTANYGIGEFAEVAIDLTALGTDPAFNPNNNPCNPPWSRMLAKTRSSAAFTSALKDFTGPYQFVDDPMVPPTLIQPTLLTCYAPTVNINPATVYPSPAVYEWSTSDGNITTRTDSTAITVNKQGTYLLKTRSFIGCSSLSDSVFVDADLAKPVIDAGGPYYVSAKNPNAVLKGNDNTGVTSLPFGPSQGLLWKWTGPNSYIVNSQTANVSDTGTYVANATEIRNGCATFAPTAVSMLSTLPISLTNFAALAINKNTIDLKWSAASEDGSENYFLERSADGIHFTPVYNVGVTRVSLSSNYGFRDDISGVTGNTVYYKIKIYSHSVLYAESKVVSINVKEIAARPHNYIISVIQRGSNASPLISYNSVTNSLMTLIVSDVDGKILYRKQQQSNVGINNVELPSFYLRNRGVKIVQVTLQNDNLSSRFIYN